MTRRMSSRRVGVASSMAFSLALMGLSACDNEAETEDGVFYCTDANGVVVPEEYCDDPDGSGSGFFFMYLGSSVHVPPGGARSYPVGHKMPANVQKFKNTASNRTTLGLPARGRIANGTVKTGVVGKGGTVGKAGTGKAGG
jgi:hypothetical protein